MKRVVIIGPGSVGIQEQIMKLQLIGYGVDFANGPDISVESEISKFNRSALATESLSETLKQLKESSYKIDSPQSRYHK